jgi:serine/threonine protein kinase
VCGSGGEGGGGVVVKLGDFGVARVLDSTQELARTKVGTPCYIAPERCEGKPYSFEADVWAMGCLLYELLTTRPAFSADTIPAVASKITSGEYEPFDDEKDAAVGADVRQLIAELLTLSPAHRPSLERVMDARVLAAQLRNHADVRESYKVERGSSPKVSSVEIPLIGYDGSSKTKFSERPVFVDGGGRIVDEANLSEHDEKLLGARQRRQRQIADKRGASGSSALASNASSCSDAGCFRLTSSPLSSSPPSSGMAPPPPNFEKVQNFGAGGVVGFLVQSGAVGGGGGDGSSGATAAGSACAVRMAGSSCRSSEGDTK